MSNGRTAENHGRSRRKAKAKDVIDRTANIISYFASRTN